jgi:predicted RNase H-like nuclease (RuvC/YqgF family)
MKDFEQVVADAVHMQRNLTSQLEDMRIRIESLNHDVNTRDGTIAELDRQLAEARNAAEHYLKWATEITQQLHNIGTFVNDAMKRARNEIEQPFNYDKQKPQTQTHEPSRLRRLEKAAE